jgi:hypothetical protein
MLQPSVIRPTFPPGYVDNPSRLLTWDHVVRRLTDAQNY